jgi:hypothetical protein
MSVTAKRSGRSSGARRSKIYSDGAIPGHRRGSYSKIAVPVELLSVRTRKLNISQMVKVLAESVPAPSASDLSNATARASYARDVARAVWVQALGLMRAALLKGYSVGLPAIGTMAPLVRRKSLRYNVNAGRMLMRPASRRVKLIMSTLLERDLRN